MSMVFKSKRGEGFSVGLFLSILFGLGILVIAILGFNGQLDYIFSKIKVAPYQNLQVKTDACKIAANQNSYNDYCNTFQPVNIAGADQLVNCQATQIQEALAKENLEYPSCSVVSAAEAGKKECINRAKAKTSDDKTIINDVKCSETITCDDLGGIVGVSKCNTGETVMNKGFKKEASTNVCCLNAVIG